MKKFSRTLAILLAAWAGGLSWEAVAGLGLHGWAAGVGIFTQVLTQLGTSQFIFNSWPIQLWELSSGTAASPITTAGPTFKISRTEQVSAATCNNNAVDNECNAALSVYNVGTSSDGMQTNAIIGGAQSATTKDNVGVYGLGVTLSGGTGIGTGAYFVGRAAASGGKNLGAELRSSNFTGAGESFFSGGYNNGSIWATADGNAKSACGACVGSSGQSFDVGFGVTNSSVVTWAFISPGYSVDPSGNLVALSYSAGASVGLSCSGTPSSSFASVNGIVTHC